MRDVIALYSTSAVDRAITFCFLLFQEIIFAPMKTQYPVVGRLSIGEPANQHHNIQIFGYSLYLNKVDLHDQLAKDKSDLVIVR